MFSLKTAKLINFNKVRPKQPANFDKLYTNTEVGCIEIFYLYIDINSFITSLRKKRQL